MSITDERYRAFEDYDETRALFLDISKAFDKVWHEGLISKLRELGFGGNILSLLTTFLKDRRQKVVLNGLESDWQSILSGVPEGSVLVPLLVLVYIHDLTEGISSNIKLFTDDSSFLSESVMLPPRKEYYPMILRKNYFFHAYLLPNNDI